MSRARLLVLPLAAGLVVTACHGEQEEAEFHSPTESADFAATGSCAAPPDAPVQLAGGTFMMGEEDVYAEEGPIRETTVDGFWIDPHEVTNRQFTAFVEATGYETIAEKPVDPSAYGVPVEHVPAELLLPGSAVFTPPERPSNNYNDCGNTSPGRTGISPTVRPVPMPGRTTP